MGCPQVPWKPHCARGQRKPGAEGLVGAPVRRRGSGTQGPRHSGMGVPPKKWSEGLQGTLGASGGWQGAWAAAQGSRAMQHSDGQLLDTSLSPDPGPLHTGGMGPSGTFWVLLDVPGHPGTGVWGGGG